MIPSIVRYCVQFCERWHFRALSCPAKTPVIVAKVTQPIFSERSSSDRSSQAVLVAV